MILSVDDCDAVCAQAIAAGAKANRPTKNEPHGRMGVVDDPFGHRWFICGPAT
jgi:uncharacterized glyoxalase superfamily protein PhnB